MNKSQAITKLRKLIGPKLGYRVNPKAADAAGRAEAHKLAQELAAKQAITKAAMMKRRDELLSDPEYQALRAEYDRGGKEHGRALSLAVGQRISVGRLNDMFFHVMADGDNWDEVITKIKEMQ